MYRETNDYITSANLRLLKRQPAALHANELSGYKVDNTQTIAMQT